MDATLHRKEVEKLHSLYHIPDEAATVKKESFSDDEMNPQELEALTSSVEVLAQKKTDFTPDALKHEYGEITIEETRIMDANYSESDQCSESKDSVSQNVDENSDNSQEVEANDSKLPKIIGIIPAIKLGCCCCISSFDTIEELRAHGREKHCDTNLESFTLQKRQCDICFKVLHSELAYDFHKKNVMYNYRCQICDGILITMEQAIAHYRLKHTGRTPTADEALICCGCKIRFRSAEALRDHSVTIHLPEKPPPDEKKPVTCNICYRNVSSEKMLRRHKLAYLERSNSYICEECGKLFGRRSNLRRHKQSYHAKSGDLERMKNFHCKECDRSYYSSSELKRHEKSRHAKSGYLQRRKNHHCKECGKSFPVPSRLRLHERKRHAKSHISSVTFDHATTSTPGAFKNEYEEIKIEETRITDAGKSDECSENKYIISDDIDENNFSNQELEAVASKAKPPRVNYSKLPKIFDKYPAVTFSCCGCISSFNTVEELRIHGREKHYDTDLECFTLKERQCDICLKVFGNMRAYDFHKKNIMYNYRCQGCDEILITQKQAIDHYRLEHAQRMQTADEVLICCGCKMQFCSAEALSIHSETIHLPAKRPRNDKKPVTCNICYRNYASKSVLRNHKVEYLFGNSAEARHREKAHIKSITRKTFVCSQCPKAYTKLDWLKAHIYCCHQPSEKSSDTILHTCNTCGCSFQKKATLDEHVQVHTAERPCQCKECGKAFQTKARLNRHIAVHTNVRPFSCSQCKRSFKTKRSLRMHMHTHSDQKRYSCLQCGKRFNSGSAKNSHTRLCSGNTMFVCPICSKDFKNKFSQVRHMRKEHPEEAPENSDDVML